MVLCRQPELQKSLGGNMPAMCGRPWFSSSLACPVALLSFCPPLLRGFLSLYSRILAHTHFRRWQQMLAGSLCDRPPATALGLERHCYSNREWWRSSYRQQNFFMQTDGRQSLAAGYRMPTPGLQIGGEETGTQTVAQSLCLL